MTSTASLSARETARERRRTRTAELFEEASRATGERRKQLLDEVVVENMQVARSIASRYRGRGVAQEDLEQVAQAALVRCVHKFDQKSADDLLSYAVPSIRGELRRYFRDHGWMVRPPRRVQELQSQVVAERDRLGGVGDTASASAIAEALDLPVQDVDDALAAQGCFQPASLDMLVTVDGGATLGDIFVTDAEDDSFASAEARAILADAVRALPERDRQLVCLRFYEGLTQSQIAEQFGVTQTQISRLLTRVLADLRKHIGELDDDTTRADRQQGKRRAPGARKQAAQPPAPVAA